MIRRSLLWLAITMPLSAVFPYAGTGAERQGSPGDRVFGSSKVVTFHLTMSEKQFAALAPAGGARFGPPGIGPQPKPAAGKHRNTFGVEFPWTKCDLIYDGTAFKDVGIRYKGNYTFMATARALKKSIKLDLNKHVDGQKLDGLTMLNLHCGVSDPWRLREAFSFAYFRAAGVPAPRTSFVELILTVPGKYDKELVGVYTLTEQVNKGFLKQHFKDGTGMLLKPEGLQTGPAFLGTSWTAYEARYKPEEEPNAEQKKRLIDFTRLVTAGSDQAFAQEIGSYLEVDAFLRFIAANTLLSNLDSYLGFGHNFYLYLVPGTKRFVFIPWDLDLSLATWPAVGTPEQLVELSIHHPHAGKNQLIDRLFAIKEHKERYLALIRELTLTSFTKEKLLVTLVDLEDALKEPMAREVKAVAARQEGRGGGFGVGFGGGQFGQTLPPRKFIDRRIESVAAQLKGAAKGFEPKPFVFGAPRPRGGGGPAKKAP